MTAIIFEIYRYNPEKDTEGYYKKYAVEVLTGTTISQVLRKIKDKADGTLTFRQGCGCAICGTCAVRINGRPMLACKTKIIDILPDLEGAALEREEIRIEPLSNSKIIKDLVVDEKHFWDNVKKAMPWLIEEQKIDMEQKHIDDMKGSQDCINCHACSSACDSVEYDDSFLGPEAFVTLHRFAKDPRDGAKIQRLMLANDNNLWNCVRTYTCIDNCPKDIRPADKITELHEMGIDQGLGGKPQRHAKHFISGLKSKGKLDELMMPIKTLRMEVLGFVPDTIKMVSKGKMPPLFGKKIVDHKEVWNLIQLAEDQKEKNKEKTS